jgi:hypothetical protein
MNDDDPDAEGLALLATQVEALVKLRAALERVRRRFDDGADDWQYGALRTVREYLKAIGFERRLIEPIQKMIFESADATYMKRRRAKGKMGTPKPSGSTSARVAAAAAVTVLKTQHNIGLTDALAKVSMASGFGRKEIGDFRDNLSRGGKRVPSGAQEAYDAAIKGLTNLSPADVLERCSSLSKYVG